MKVLDLIPGGNATLIVAALVAASYGGWWMRDLQADAAEGVRLMAEEDARELLGELAGKVNAATSEAIRGIRITNTTIHQKTVSEVQRETVYADCTLPDAGRVLHREARNAANARIPALPAPAKPAR